MLTPEQIAEIRTKTLDNVFGDAAQSIAFARAIEAALSAQPAEPACVGRDPLCPCVDGYACHYADAGKTKAFAQPAEPKHDLFTNADKDRPKTICDSNSEVVLGLCKRCGKGESELESPCVAEPAHTLSHGTQEGGTT